MNGTHRPISLLVAFVLILTTSACKKFVDINGDPNNPTEPNLSLLLSGTQVSIAGNFTGINSGGSAVVQHWGSGNLNRWDQSGGTFSSSWSGFYTGAIPDLETIIKTGTEQQQWGYVSIAKLQKAYLYSIMVDVWGNIPYTQAGGSYTDPVFDKGQDIYNSLFTLIDEALADMEKGFTVTSSADLFYQGSKERWQRMAHSLKLKMFNQIRLADPARAEQGIRTLLSSGVPLMTQNAHDFTFRYGSNVTPNSRHPWYINSYNTSRSGYMSMTLINRLKQQDDPRLRYYVFRMRSNAGLANATNGDGYYGRYPGDGAASPADHSTRAISGIYPAAGLYDNGTIATLTSANQLLNNEGASAGTTANSFRIALFTSGDGTGAGILPLITNAMVNFIRAEAALTLNTGEDARKLLLDAVTAQLTSVSTLSASNKGNAIPAATITGFITRLGQQYDAADAAGKMQLLMMQKWIALYGNGVEAYNDYRRTGLPQLEDLVSPLDTFPFRFYYSETEMTSNASVIANRDAVQRAQQLTPVFWDK
ncbi:SusD/RagB family nutrient-binding outer membrane lipoprotein [Siphonobacter sp. BAB-5385]|uniref:SusD/RagB family nutrient-binding outer membrane lipoprotein n=1 Tax=Siphonobacter sp. BAB-5385 TaxID=1864822 RepID=UPI000B9E5E88|nr:SusD/RagB family nutrient-binding outer membrane lipoprotein [Siphonobacter sp. BAB-5385]OZI06629.1 SusD/RagB family nutrient-binding outer membrane lipoprotein [Siphonobacter sp. BAB-5385]